jgi:hypothetical protein
VYNSVTGLSCGIGDCEGSIHLIPEPVQIKAISDWRGYYVFHQSASEESEILFAKVQPALIELVRSGRGKPMRAKGDLILVGSDNLSEVLAFFSTATLDLAEACLARSNIPKALDWSHCCLTFDHTNEKALRLMLDHGSDPDVIMARTLLSITAEHKLSSV